MQPLDLKPTHKLVKNYYQALGQFGQLNIDHEMAVRDAFQDLLKGCGQKFHWTLVPEYSFSRPKQNPIRIDGALLDTFRLPHGYWEAKDEHDDLDKEIRAKLAKGYPHTDIIFQAPTKAVPDWALNEFRTHYSDTSFTKWDIFHYVHVVLHHPEYREPHAANLKRELPRIPFVTAGARRSTSGPKVSVGNAVSPKGDTIVAQGVSPGSASINEPEPLQGRHKTAGPSTRADNGKRAGGNRGPSTPAATDAAFAQDDKSIFWSFANAGRLLADLHVNYEQQPEYPLERVEKGQLNWLVEKMHLTKDKTTHVYNDFLTLKNIPPETYEYRLGNRSALEWVIDQYQVSTDKRSGITNDPNRADDPEYIVRLIGQVITVSLETIKIVKSLPPLMTDHVELREQNAC